jgi:hypothetical protein
MVCHAPGEIFDGLWRRARSRGMRLLVKAPTSFASRDIVPLVPFNAVFVDLPIFGSVSHEFSHLRSF